MRVLVIGLGSMGKRRVRNTLAIGGHDIAGFDVRADRQTEAASKYGIKTYSSLESAMNEFNPSVFIISTPPNYHMDYAFIALERNISCFIEASVTDVERMKELSGLSINSGLVFAPSCTMSFYPGPIEIKKIVESGNLGRVLNINYQSGQYLPDWHPWEDISEYYVSNRSTGGCREIVPFELTWLNKIFGDPIPLACVKSKLTDMPADIDDIYHSVVQYPNGVILNLTVDVISRPKATRYLRIYGTEGMLIWDSEQNKVIVSKTSIEIDEVIDLEMGTVERNYINPEEPYINEMKAFYSAVEINDGNIFPNTLEEDIMVLELLNKLENIAEKDLSNGL